MKKILFPLFICAMICLAAESCHDNSNRDKANQDRETITEDISGEPDAPTFFGNSTLTIVSSNRPNGYLVKIFQTKDITLLNLSRGDSINQYIAIHEIPASCSGSFPDLASGMYTGTYIREVNIPVEKDELGWGLFFMDVNFDGEEELLIEHSGYNRCYYACFDVVHGKPDVSPGILQPMNEPPYGNIVSGSDDIYTEFDYNKKTIHIFEQMGCCSHVEIWCEMVKDWDFEEPKLQVVKREKVEYRADGYIETTLSKRVDGELQQISTTLEKDD